MIEVAVRRLREDAQLPTQAYPGDAGLDLVRLRSGRRSSPASGPSSRRASRSRFPRGTPGFVQPRSGLAARHGIGVVNSPGLIDSGYRGEIRVVLINTDREQRIRSRAGNAHRPARDRARRERPARRGRRSSRSASAGPAASGRRRADVRGAENPRLGHPPLARAHPAHPAREGGREVWLLPGGGVQTGESLIRALQRELWEETGLFPFGEEVPLEGPVAIVDSISPQTEPIPKARRARDLRRRRLGVARGGRLAGRRRARPSCVPAARARLDRASSADPAVPAALAARATRPSTSARCGSVGGIGTLAARSGVTTRSASALRCSGWWAGVPLGIALLAPSAAVARSPRDANASPRARRSGSRSAARLRWHARAPAPGASPRATGSAAAVGRGGTSRPRSPADSPRIRTRRRSRTRTRPGRAARAGVEQRPSRVVLEPGERARRARLELALEQDVADHPRVARPPSRAGRAPRPA